MCAESKGMPDHGEVHLWLGRCRLHLGQNEAAVQEFTSSIKLDPTDPAAHRGRAQAFKVLNQPEKAAADDKRAEELEKGEDGKGKGERGRMRDEG
jgi:Flp pilus assembly protein TadD